MDRPLSRRQLLTRSALIGCSTAASPLITPISFAAAPWDNRLAVIILRGAMDGLDALRPQGDPDYAALRGTSADRFESGGEDLDGFFTLHPALQQLLPLWRRGELSFAHAVSTPYRNKRSHFDGQDILEAGILAPDAGRSRDGWLNRLLQIIGSANSDTAFAIGRDNMMILSGAAPVSNWTPEANLALSPQALALARIVMAADKAFNPVLDAALALADGDGDPVMLGEDGGTMLQSMMANMKPDTGKNGHLKIAEFAADRFRGEARVASFSLNGWDTHKNQHVSLPKALTRLSETILTLEKNLGAIWGKTVVVAMTEFGRTARLNGTHGTDHGTGSTMLMAGGALRGGVVHSQWPGLAEVDLYQRRDLMPTADVRNYAAWLMHDLFGLSKPELQEKVFPGLLMTENPRLIL